MTGRGRILILNSLWTKTRWFSMYALVALLAACGTSGSSCSYFSRDNSMACDAMLVGLAIAGPPVEAMDNALFEKSRQAAREKELAAQKARRLPLYEDMRRRVRAGDRDALRSCVTECPGLGYMLVSREESTRLEIEVATALVRVAGTSPEADDVAPLVVAIALLARQDATLDNDIIRTGYALTQRADFFTLAKLNPYSRHGGAFESAVGTIYGHHLALRVLAEPELRAAFDKSCGDTLRANYQLSSRTFIGPDVVGACVAADRVLDARRGAQSRQPSSAAP